METYFGSNGCNSKQKKADRNTRERGEQGKRDMKEIEGEEIKVLLKPG